MSPSRDNIGLLMIGTTFFLFMWWMAALSTQVP